jgi:hypothetical protein
MLTRLSRKLFSLAEGISAYSTYRNNVVVNVRTGDRYLVVSMCGEIGQDTVFLSLTPEQLDRLSENDRSMAVTSLDVETFHPDNKCKLDPDLFYIGFRFWDDEIRGLRFEDYKFN